MCSCMPRRRAGMSLQEGQGIAFETKIEPTRGKTNAADVKPV